MPRAGTPSPVQMITLAIIARLEQGVRPWTQPWRSTGTGGRPLRSNGEPYRGINAIWLWHVADVLGYSSRTWMTYRQAQALGAQVRKGERSQMALFYKSYTQTRGEGDTSGSNDQEPAATRRVLRTYAVFSVDQIEGLPASFYPEPTDTPPPTDILPDAAQRFIGLLPATIRHGGDRAFYHRGQDFIAMPPVELFQSRAQWAATLAHEAGHWTGHPSRLDRQFGQRFGDDAYAMEELCAELCASLLGADLGLPPEHLDNHASYIDHWLKVLRADGRALFTIATKAEAAASFLLDFTSSADRRPAGENCSSSTSYD